MGGWRAFGCTATAAGRVLGMFAVGYESLGFVIKGTDLGWYSCCFRALGLLILGFGGARSVGANDGIVFGAIGLYEGLKADCPVGFFPTE